MSQKVALYNFYGQKNLGRQSSGIELNKGNILHVPSTFQRAIVHLKAHKKLNFIVIVADFQIADQKQNFFERNKKEMSLFYGFLHG